MFFYRHNLDDVTYLTDGERLHQLTLTTRAEMLHTKNAVVTYKIEEEEEVHYLLVDMAANFDLMGYCSLSRLDGWVALETNILFVPLQYRRQGVAEKLYDAVLEDGQILICGWSHNPKSRALWKKMCMNEKYVVWAQDMVDTSRTSDIWYDDEGEMICQLKVYVDIKKQTKKLKEDVRLVAVMATR